uniref:Uncharacterized protein n=1 Tax=Anguilla anguilla TaxID=7936 RepID=A0A0E9SC07_ANGAN
MTIYDRQRIVLQYRNKGSSTVRSVHFAYYP